MTNPSPEQVSHRPPADVEREPAGPVPLLLRRRGVGEQLADVVEQPGVGRQVRPGGAADRLLVHHHQPADPVHAPSLIQPPDRGQRRPLQLPRPPHPARRPAHARGGRPPTPPAPGRPALDLPDPLTPVTAVSTPSGNAASRPVQVVPGHAGEPQPAARLPRNSRAAGGPAGNRWRRVCDSVDAPEAVRRAAVQDPAAVLARVRPDIHDPVGVPHHLQLVLDDEQGVAGRLEPSRARSSASVSAGCSPADGSSRTYTTPNRLLTAPGSPAAAAGVRPARGSGCSAFQRQVAEPEVEQHGQPAAMSRAIRRVTSACSGWADRPSRPAVAGGPRRRTVEDRGQPLERLAGHLARCPGRRTSPTGPRGGAACPGRSGSRRSPGTGPPAASSRALGLGERLQDVPPGAGERPQVVVRLLPLLDARRTSSRLCAGRPAPAAARR